MTQEVSVKGGSFRGDKALITLEWCLALLAAEIPVALPTGLR